MPFELIHDGSIDIATGRSRKDLHWKNKEIQWSDFIEQVSITQRTAETHAVYVSSKKQRQDEIKDIGGFVGGYLSSGRRKQGNVLHRQLVTLDIDFARPGIWDDFILLYDCAAVVYSTHKHTPVNPRLRLILPLDRAVQPDEYVAISRRIAGDLGIEYFDHTTFEPSRLMYWPSTSKDGEYFFEYQDGPWISADALLKTYHNWRDSSEWPVSEKYNTIIQNAIKKQGDPLEKSGVIGAFCRTYSIEEAIETFLADEYTSCAVEGRYTYKHGSTSAGLVIYEGKYAYSHHGTDPVSGKLCNAFDLVRLHKYGLKDEDAREGTPGNKLPSYTAMVEFAAKDPEVKKTAALERIAGSQLDFKDDAPVEEEDINVSWLTDLETDSKNKLLASRNNFKLILENDPFLKNKFAFDLFSKRTIVTGKVPWRRPDDDSLYWSDVDMADLRIYMAAEPYGISHKDNIKDAFVSVSAKRAVHPVKEYLNDLVWDGVERIESLFIDYLGAEDSAYVRAVTRKALTAAIARIYEPGIKFDYVLTLVGEEGKQKSTILRKLGRKWFSDSFSFNAIKKGKEAFEVLQGYWIIEIGELTGLGKADIEGVKQFISKQDDIYRLPHATYTSKFDRQCVFFGSTNQWDFLRGYNGNRRFWPVIIDKQPAVKNPAKDMTDEVVDQIWAEAKYLYKKGETLYLSKELEDAAKEVQKTHTESDERVGLIEKYLNTLLPENWLEKPVNERIHWLKYQDTEDLLERGEVVRQQVCAAEIWCELFEGKQKDMTTINTKYIHDIMRRIPGWELVKSPKRFSLYGPQRAYVRTGNFDPKNVNSVNSNTGKV